MDYNGDSNTGHLNTGCFKGRFISFQNHVTLRTIQKTAICGVSKWHLNNKPFNDRSDTFGPFEYRTRLVMYKSLFVQCFVASTEALVTEGWLYFNFLEQIQRCKLSTLLTFFKEWIILRVIYKWHHENFDRKGRGEVGQIGVTSFMNSPHQKWKQWLGLFCDQQLE